jgi:hypothetical protein
MAWHCYQYFQGQTEVKQAEIHIKENLTSYKDILKYEIGIPSFWLNIAFRRHLGFSRLNSRFKCQKCFLDQFKLSSDFAFLFIRIFDFFR